MEIEILSDLDSVLAVRKPAGLATQAPREYDSLESRLREQLSDRTSYVAFPHRLDRPVSGIILVALTKRAARLLSDQFASRKTSKTYLAWVRGHASVEPADVVWNDWIRKIPDEARAECCQESDAGSKAAETRVRFVAYDDERDQTLLQFNPVTGRMHQLRVQAAKYGHPILGDVQYGADPVQPENRILLHASAIEFHDARTGKRVKAECPDEDFRFSV